MEVVVDEKSGFCFGVKNAIGLAEKALAKKKKLYCLGDIVHNEEEVTRLAKLGLEVIDQEIFKTLSDCTVLIRAHGEPPSTYHYAKENNIDLIEGTCPVVLKIQEKVRKAYNSVEQKGSIVIYGKENHAEVIGLNGQTNEQAIVLKEEDKLKQLNYSKPIRLFAQTTMDKTAYENIKNLIAERSKEAGGDFESINSICGQVSNRGKWLTNFSKKVDALVFVGGKKSSNSKVLFQICKKENSNSYFIHSVNDLQLIDLSGFKKVGVCGATSTPQWLMDDVAEQIKETYK